MKITPLEGNRHALDGGAMFGHVPKAVWTKFYLPDEKNRIELASRALLIEDDKGDLFLFDGTIGTILPPKEKEHYGVVGEENQLLVSLKKQGVEPHEIKGVILSHLHFDHVGGIFSRINGKLSLLFPKADLFVTRTHFERACKPRIRERASFLEEVPPVLKESGKLKLLESGDPLPFPAEWYVTEGHTVGLMVMLLYAPHLVALTTDLIPGIPGPIYPLRWGMTASLKKRSKKKKRCLKEW